MATVETSELIGPALDWAVAKALGMNCWLAHGVTVDGLPMVCADNDGDEHWQPSIDWNQGGPLIDKNGIGFHVITPAVVCASVAGDDWDYNGFLQKEMEGESHLVAAMRAIVAAKTGSVVQVPDELTPT